MKHIEPIVVVVVVALFLAQLVNQSNSEKPPVVQTTQVQMVPKAETLPRPTPVIVNWLRSYDEAKEVSARVGKPVFAVVSLKSGCPPCEQLKATTLQDPEVIEFLNENTVPMLDETGDIAFLRQAAKPVVWLRSIDGKTGWVIKEWRNKSVFLQQLRKLTR